MACTDCWVSLLSLSKRRSCPCPKKSYRMKGPPSNLNLGAAGGRPASQSLPEAGGGMRTQWAQGRTCACAAAALEARSELGRV